MGQLTIYLDAETEKQLKAAAKSARMPVSRWVAEAIREKTERGWPQAILDLAGAWPDFPSTEQLRAAQPSDSHREDL